ncbi:DUF2971 domain-containing protein [Adhaeribacter aquaticus]|uniref:DUF2971 domain-containing protein n=1 Tax=Adhaeribacter aquaticus TaxID=299567 RepID=UPI00040D0D26|nr:DUF2971 domain-containing protein [Adhaeribacter aquaticus]
MDFEIYSEIVPQIPKLYHYTSQAGLLGIVKYKKLWFTNIHYMNDSSEYTCSLELIEAALKKYYNLGEEFYKLFPDGKESEPIFSFSLSEAGDLLSQWRGYCPNGGYSIALFDQYNLNQINSMMKECHLYIGKCLYKPEQIEDFVMNKIVQSTPEEVANSIKRFSQENDTYNLKQSLYETILDNIVKYAPLIKNEAFEGEQEWRIVANHAEPRKLPRRFIKNIEAVASTTSITLSWTNAEEYIPFEAVKESLKFREGKSFLIPYLEIPLAQGDYSINISEIIIGPTPHKELSRDACGLLLNIDLNNIIPSKIPYRTW